MSDTSDRVAKDVRENAALVAHGLAIKWWDERKISADFTTADENDLAAVIVAVVNEYAGCIAQEMFSHERTDNVVP